MTKKAFPDRDLWLERWLAKMRTFPSGCDLLELGCGPGRDTKFLTERGFRVVAVDISQDALAACAREVPTAHLLQHDLAQPLPFADRRFCVVLASLSLHYFPWFTTLGILAEVRRCLTLGGLLVSRFNSTNDVNYGARGFRELEPNFYDVAGRNKRFFDVQAVNTLFSSGWRLESAQEQMIARYRVPKVVWEVVARRTE